MTENKYTSLRIEALKKYLRLTDWKRVESIDRWIVFEGSKDVDGNPLEIVLPTDSHVPDVGYYITNAVSTLSVIEDLSHDCIIEKINSMDIKGDRYMPELGQMAFGNPWGEFECPRFACALLDYLLVEIERVFWNQNQREWDRREDPQIFGIEFLPYYWWPGVYGECPDELEERLALRPNFKLSGDDLAIRWYKSAGRGQTVNKQMTEQDWRIWFDKALALIDKADYDEFEGM